MNIQEFLKGILIGVAKIIPGLSGSVLMISFNLYDKAIDSITNFFKDIKANFLFLANLSIGIIIGIVIFSNILSYFINNYYTYTTSLFIGLILGGVPLILQSTQKSKKGYILTIISLTIMSIISLTNINFNYIIQNNFLDSIVFFGGGLLEALGTVVPGISSTALLMLVGIYNIYLEVLSNIFNFHDIIANITFLIPFSLGLLLGIILLSLLINYLFKNYRKLTFSFILGVTLSSILLLLIKVLTNIASIIEIPICIIFLIIGSYITKKKKKKSSHTTTYKYSYG